MLSLLLAPCPSAAGGAGRGRSEAACAGVEDCDWVATWGCLNDDGSDGFRCRSMLTNAYWSLRVVRTSQPHVCCTYRRRRAARPGRDCKYAARVPGPGVTVSRGTTGAAACSARRAWRRTGCSSTTLALALALARADRARTLALTRILTGTLTR